MVHGRTLRLLVCLMMFQALAPMVVSAQDEPSAAEFEAVFHLVQTKSKLRVIEKFSKIIESKTRIARVDGFDPDLISVRALSPTRLRVQALKPGVTTLSMVDENDQLYSLELFVTGDVRHLQAYINQLFPHSSVEAVEVKDSVVLRGWVTQPENITEIVDIAEQFYPKVLNQMKVGGVQQVLLKVKVIEVQRSKIRKFGFSFLHTDNNGFVGSNPGGLANLNAGNGMATAASTAASIAFGIINTNSVFTGFLEALKDEGLLKIKAEPVLVTTNGRPAELLNGGEFPIVVPQSLGTTSVQFRPFGVELRAVPIILGNGRLRLELEPEVSERDFANGVNVGTGFVPGLKTRRVNTQVEMQFGQTLMIAGLISQRNNGSTSKIPLLGEIPWLGAAFSAKEFEESETELIVMVTPEYVAPLEAGEVPPLGPGESTDVPTDRELYIDGMLEVPKYGERCQDCPFPTPMMQSYPSQGSYLMDPAPMQYEQPAQVDVPPAPGTDPSTFDAPAVTDPQSRNGWNGRSGMNSQMATDRPGFWQQAVSRNEYLKKDVGTTSVQQVQYQAPRRTAESSRIASEDLPEWARGR